MSEFHRIHTIVNSVIFSSTRKEPIRRMYERSEVCLLQLAMDLLIVDRAYGGNGLVSFRLSSPGSISVEFMVAAISSFIPLAIV